MSDIESSFEFQGVAVALRRASGVVLWLSDVEAAVGLPELPEDLYGLPASAIIVQAREKGRMGRPLGKRTGERKSIWIKADRLDDLAGVLPPELSASRRSLVALAEAAEAWLAGAADLPDGVRWLCPVDAGREVMLRLGIGDEEVPVFFDADSVSRGSNGAMSC